MPCASAKLQRAWKIDIERSLRKILPAVEGTSATTISKPRWMTRHPGFSTKAPGPNGIEATGAFPFLGFGSDGFQA